MLKYYIVIYADDPDAIWIKKYLWYYKLIKSDSGRKAREVLMRQMTENQQNWYNESKQHSIENKIPIEEKTLDKRTIQE